MTTITQLSMFDDIPAQTKQVKVVKPLPKTLFALEELIAPAKRTDLHGDWRGTLSLEKEDPRTEEQKEADLQADARALTQPMDFTEQTLAQALQAMTFGDALLLRDGEQHARIECHGDNAFYLLTWHTGDPVPACGAYLLVSALEAQFPLTDTLIIRAER